jgi:signal transduction histidine kinase
MLEVIALTRSELRWNGTSLQTQPQTACRSFSGIGPSATSRNLLIRTEQDGPGSVRVAVQDSGPGLKPESLDRLFDAFYTTKPDGLGMGVSICRSIIEAHDGRVWATPNLPQGAAFQFTLPRQRETAS